MPRRNLNEHFEEERPEWTKRKHNLLARYVKAAAMKMRLLKGRAVALVDGYAGVNAYGPELTGSTAIMVDAARAVQAQGDSATVYACEPDKDRFEALRTNLGESVDAGLLVPYCMTHARALPTIFEAIGAAPAVVFLDPQTITQMTLKDDIRPWAARANTDVLGVFMAGQACRTCGQFLKTEAEQEVEPEAYLGSKWREANTEEGALNAFMGAIGGSKRYVGMYRLRKLEPLRYAYGIFGMSDHSDGLALLSNAVAKDFSVLEAFDFRKSKEGNLFAESDREEQQQASFERLVEIARTTIEADPGLRGADLASLLFR